MGFGVWGLGFGPLDPRHEASDEAHEEAIKAQVAEQQAEDAGLFYNAMDKRAAKHVLDKDSGRPATVTEH